MKDRFSQGYSAPLGMVCARVIRESEYLSSITAFRMARLELNAGNLEAAASRMRPEFDKVQDDKERKVIGAFLDSKEFREKINNAR